MEVFLAGTPVTVPAAFNDRAGNPLEVAAAAYRVLNHAGEELLGNTVLFGTFPVEGEVEQPVEQPGPEVPAESQEPPVEADPGETIEPEPQAFNVFGQAIAAEEPSATESADGEVQPQAPVLPESIVIPAEVNMIAALDLDAIESEDMDGIDVRELRTVMFTLLLAGGNTIARKYVYALEPTDALITGLNSFQAYEEAELVALNIPSMDGWNAASEQERLAAMVDARLRILRLQFRDASRGQSYLGEEVLVGDLSRLPPREFKGLSVRLRAALCKAQVAEADALLGGDPEAERRKSGLIHETVGESTQIWRTSKPLELPVSRKAMSYLAGFVSMSKGVGRA